MQIVFGKAYKAQGTSSPGFRTGLDLLDHLPPGGEFRCGAIHELLCGTEGSAPKSFALLLARAAQIAAGGMIVWSDPARELYPPALSILGIDPARLILLRPGNAAEEIRLLAECLRCRGVGATVASPRKLSRVEARRLQLAAERGGGVGLFLRPPACRGADHYAAATRWIVRPVPGDDEAQRWSVELVHGHGGRVGCGVLLEVDRETGVMRASAALADRSAATPPARATA